MACGLRRCEAPVTDVLFNQGMVPCELREGAGSDQVGPAIADVQNK